MSGPVLSIQGVTRRFGGFTALSDVSLEVAAGERIGILGPNGAGKSTLVNCVAGTLACDRGEILMGGQRVNRLAPHRRAQLGLARTFQIPRPYRSMTVLQNVCIPIEFHAVFSSATEVHERGLQALRMVGIEARAAEHPARLSQVELRKLELARALALRPSVLIADEAMAGLSSSEVDEIVELLLRLNADGVAVLLIEHIMRAVVKFSERVVVLVAGAKIADGPTAQVMRDAQVIKAYLGE